MQTRDAHRQHSGSRTSTWLLWFAAVIAVGATAVTCSCPSKPVDPEPNGVPPEPTLNVPPLEACGVHQVIAKRADGEACPGVGGEALAESGALSEFCVYEKPASPQQPWGPGEGVDYIGDCPVHVQEGPTTTSPTEELTWQRELFEAKVGYVPSAAFADFKGGVSIAVIDTIGPQYISNPFSQHGPLMASIIRDLAHGCINTDSCPRSVRTYLGLPYTLGDNGQPLFNHQGRGGRYGYSTTVARAIKHALADWRKLDQKEQKLIINLSLGWIDIEKKPFTDPAFEMLERASCNGALIFAASGNRSPNGCDDPNATLAPAAWNRFHRPDQSRCDELEEPYNIEDDDVQQPLVHAITAVDESNEPLIGNRSSEGLAAYGKHAVCQGWTSSTNVGPMAGTSVSTAVVSGIAAAVWSKDPSFNTEVVMGRLSGSPTVPPTAISVCQALEVACPPTPTMTTPVSSAPTTLASVSGAPACLNSQITTIGPSGGPVATPQPDELACPLCHIDYDASGKGTLHLQLSNQYTNPQGSMVVTLWAAGPSKESNLYTLVIPFAPNWQSFTSEALTGVGASNLPPTKAWIDIQFADAAGATFWAGNELDLRR